jgi:hypothetical protein
VFLVDFGEISHTSDFNLEGDLLIGCSVVGVSSFGIGVGEVAPGLNTTGAGNLVSF